MSSTQVSVDPATETPRVASVPDMDARQSGSSPGEASAAAGRYMAEVEHVVVPSA